VSASGGVVFLDTVVQTTADTYRRIFQLPAAPAARTCSFASGLDRLYLAAIFGDRRFGRPKGSCRQANAKNYSAH
jgi:hypothetical protein